MVILKGNTMLNPLQTSELSIRQTLCEVFRRKFSMISPTDFFYVKRGRNKLVFMETGPGQHIYLLLLSCIYVLTDF